MRFREPSLMSTWSVSSSSLAHNRNTIFLAPKHSNRTQRPSPEFEPVFGLLVRAWFASVDYYHMCLVPVVRFKRSRLLFHSTLSAEKNLLIFRMKKLRQKLLGPLHLDARTFRRRIVIAPVRLSICFTTFSGTFFSSLFAIHSQPFPCPLHSGEKACEKTDEREKWWKIVDKRKSICYRGVRDVLIE